MSKSMANLVAFIIVGLLVIPVGMALGIDWWILAIVIIGGFIFALWGPNSRAAR